MALRVQAYIRSALAAILALVMFRLFPLQLDAEYVDGGSRLIFSVDSAGNAGGFMLYLLTCGWLAWAWHWPSSTCGQRVKATQPLQGIANQRKAIYSEVNNNANNRGNQAMQLINAPR